jgi:REP element-mobilizing transposase RayT
LAVPRLRRFYGLGYLHFIRFSCYRRLRFLGTARRRDLFLRLQEQARRRYRFVVVGYVAMPEHVHLLVSEPEKGDPGCRCSWQQSESPAFEKGHCPTRAKRRLEWATREVSCAGTHPH